MKEKKGICFSKENTQFFYYLFLLKYTVIILNCKKKTPSGHSREGGNLFTISVLNLDSGLLQAKTGMTVLHFIFSCVNQKTEWEKV